MKKPVQKVLEKIIQSLIECRDEAKGKKNLQNFLMLSLKQRSVIKR